VERDLRVALTEKMIVDFDYLPLPDLGENPLVGGNAKGGKKKKAGK
jgi:hypothetical protein